MNIVSQLTPVYYDLRRIGIEQQEDVVVSILDLVIRSEEGRELGTDHPVAELTPAEKQAVVAYANRTLQAYEATTGLTKWVEPVEEEPE